MAIYTFVDRLFNLCCFILGNMCFLPGCRGCVSPLDWRFEDVHRVDHLTVSHDAPRRIIQQFVFIDKKKIQLRWSYGRVSPITDCIEMRYYLLPKRRWKIVEVVSWEPEEDPSGVEGEDRWVSRKYVINCRVKLYRNGRPIANEQGYPASASYLFSPELKRKLWYPEIIDPKNSSGFRKDISDHV